MDFFEPTGPDLPPAPSGGDDRRDAIDFALGEAYAAVNGLDESVVLAASEPLDAAVSDLSDVDATVRGQISLALEPGEQAITKADTAIVRAVNDSLIGAINLLGPIEALVVDVDNLPLPNPFPGPIPVPNPQPPPPDCQPSCTVTDQQGTHCVGIPNPTDLECCGTRYPTGPNDPCCFDNYLTGEVVCPPGVEPPPEDTLPGNDCDPCPEPAPCPPVQTCEECPECPAPPERCMPDPWCLPPTAGRSPNKVYPYLEATQSPINAWLSQL